MCRRISVVISSETHSYEIRGINHTFVKTYFSNLHLIKFMFEDSAGEASDYEVKRNLKKLTL